jgi:RNA recognition motif-containing protein
VWVGNVGEDVTEEEFRRVASAYGHVESVKFLRQKMCAFVNYMTEREAMAALSGMQGLRLGSAIVKVNFGRPLPPSRQTSFPDGSGMGMIPGFGYGSGSQGGVGAAQHGYTPGVGGSSGGGGASGAYGMRPGHQ